MKFSTLQRWGGIAIILGSVFLTAWAICWSTLLPAHERARDLSKIILDPHWIWIASLAFPGIILMIFGYTAVYSRLYTKAGISGFIGYIFNNSIYFSSRKSNLGNFCLSHNRELRTFSPTFFG